MTTMTPFALPPIAHADLQRLWIEADDFYKSITSKDAIVPSIRYALERAIARCNFVVMYLELQMHEEPDTYFPQTGDANSNALLQAGALQTSEHLKRYLAYLKEQTA